MVTSPLEATASDTGSSVNVEMRAGWVLPRNVIVVRDGRTWEQPAPPFGGDVVQVCRSELSAWCVNGLRDLEDSDSKLCRPFH
ncbi:hypothetical protein [Burkholderia ubonensis]|uniref:hypothetical protein n=1 Tax=Burkholderia ubonensis TaxID=101571 RepID=UPI0012FA8694|nr:hypothetical protein [Burkholderia ubonensis]